MLKVFIPVLQSSLEIAFVVAVVLAWLEARGPRQLLQVVKRGLILAMTASVGLAYGVETFLQREPVEGVISLLAVLSAMAFVLRIVWTRNKVLDISEGSDGQISPIIQGLATLAMIILVLPLGLDVALAFSEAFTGIAELVSTEMAVSLSAGLLALAVPILLGIVLRRVISRLRSSWVSAGAAIILIILLVQEVTVTLQVALGRGVIPLSDWLFRPAVVLINNYSAFYWAFLTSISVLVMLAMWEHHHHRPNTEDMNPAQQRKARAGYRRMGVLSAIAAALLGMVILVGGASAVYANRPLQLSPATPVTAQDDVVSIPMDSLSDGKMYRFSYQTTDGTSIRFLAIHKGSGVYGIGLDACEFCGVAGYRQEGENVICNRCQAAINVVTIGFPGGCNPIPIDSEKNSDSLVIQVEVLEKVKGVFAQ